MNKIPILLLACTATMTGLLLVCLLSPEPAAGHGVPHPDFPQMNQGGTAQRHENLITIAGLYGALQIVVLVAGLCLGICHRSRLFPMLLGGSAYLAIYTAVVVTYSNGMDNAPTMLGFPLPTMLMVFGLWGTPWFFVVMYVVKFKAWVFDDNDARKFAELLAKSRVEPSREQLMDSVNG